MLHRGDRIVIPDELQSRVIQLAHEGHFGMTLVKRRLREYYWWPAIDRHVEETVRNCQYCANSDKSYTCHTIPLQPVQLPDKVWQKLALDIMGPFNDPKHKFVIVLADYCSKWCEVAFETEVTTDKMIHFLDNVFAREGLPEFLVTDNGVQLTSHKIKEFLKGNGITHLLASLYHPQINGLVERMNRTVKEGVQIGKLEGKSPVLATRERLSAYHTTPNTTTGKTPFQLMRGRCAKTKLQIIPTENVVDDHEQIAKRVLSKQNRYKAYHDSKPCVKVSNVKVGDYVRMKNPRHVGKGEVKYSKNMEVVKVNGSCVTLKDGGKWNMSKIVKCTTTNVPNHVKYQGDNDSGYDNFHYMDISYSNNQQAVPVERGPDVPVDNDQIPNVAATRKSCRMRRIPRRLIE